MAIFMLEGFEMIEPSVEMTAEQVEYLFLANKPDVVDDWFSSTDDSVQHNTNGRIAGTNCLRFTRGDDLGTNWARKWGANLGFSFQPKQTVCLGFAVQYERAPTKAIPLAGFRYDTGFGDVEQVSLWALPDGKLYISAVPYDPDADTITTAINPLAVTGAGAIRFNKWTYVEFVVSYTSSNPTLTVRLNGEIILDGISDDTFQQIADEPWISSAHIFNPTTAHFGDEGYWQSVDDVYLDNANAQGPQWIVGLTNGSMTYEHSPSSAGWSGVPSNTYPGAGAVQAEEFGDYIMWDLSNPPADVGTVSAIGISVIASITDSIDAFSYGVGGPTGAGTVVRKRSSISDGPARCFRYVRTTAPTGTTLTGTGLNALQGFLLASDVVA